MKPMTCSCCGNPTINYYIKRVGSRGRKASVMCRSCHEAGGSAAARETVFPVRIEDAKFNSQIEFKLPTRKLKDV